MHAFQARGLALVAALLCMATAGHAQTFPTDIEWSPVTVGGATLHDPAGDAGTNADRDIVRPMEPSALMCNDSEFIYFRLRVDGDPQPLGVWNLAIWGVEIDTDHSDMGYELFALVSGRESRVELWRNTTMMGTTDDQAEDLIATYPIATHARSLSDGSADFFVDWAVPIADVTADTSIRVVFGTSTNATPRMTTGTGRDVAGVTSCGCGLGSVLSDELTLNCQRVGVPDVRRMSNGGVSLAVAPNPVSTSCRFDVSLARAQAARLTVHSVDGRVVRRLADRELAPGIHSIWWDGADERGNPVASGVYFAELTTGDAVARKAVLRIR
jgi:hypothetical protein